MSAPDRNDASLRLRRGELYSARLRHVFVCLSVLNNPGEHMQAPGIPENEEQRLKSLYITGLLDTRD